MLKITRKKDTYGDSFGDDSFYNESDFNNMDIEDEASLGFGVEAVQPVAEAAPAPAAIALKIINPKGYDEAPEIVDLLMNGNTVLINIENLKNLDLCPRAPFLFACLPIKVKKSDGAPARAVAILND